METIHLRNIQKFQQFIQHCQQLGEKYNPKLEYMQTSNLEKMYDKGFAQLHIVEMQMMIYEHTLSLLGAELEYMRKLVEGMDTLFQNSKANVKLKYHAAVWLKKTLTFQIQPTKTVKKHAESSADYELLLENLAYCIEIISPVRKNLAEEAIKHLDEMQKLWERMTKLNADTKQAEKTLELAKKERNAFYYLHYHCIADIMKDCKKYIKAIFGAESEAYLLAEAIQLEKIK